MPSRPQKTGFSRKAKFLFVLAALAVPAVGFLAYQATGGAFVNVTLDGPSAGGDNLIAHYTFDGSDIDLSTASAEIQNTASSDLATPSDWYDEAYTYCRPMTVDHTAVATSTSNGFALYASSTIASLSHTSHGGNIELLQEDDVNTANQVPTDVVITDGTDCNSNSGTKVPFYFEDYASTTGAFDLWMEASSISSTTDTTYLMYYGNDSATDQSNESGVFGANGAGAVWNLHENPGTAGAGGIRDSTSNSNDGTDNGAMDVADQLSGQVDGALAFDGSDDYIDAGTDPSINVSGAVTVTAWIYLSSTGADQKILGNQDGSAGGYKMGLYTSDKVEFEIRNSSNTAVLNRSVSGGTALSGGRWYHVTGVYSDADDYLATYVNGTVDRSMSTTESLASSGALRIGREPFNSDYYFSGRMDDIRIFDHRLSDADIRTIYNNTRASNDFWSIGSQQQRNDMSNPTANWKNHASTTVSGALGQAISFDGVDDYIDVGGIGQPRSISFWVNPDSDTGELFKLSDTATRWYDLDYGHCQEITINSSQVATTTSDGFALLASTTQSALKSTAHGGNVEFGDGRDIVYTNGDDCSEQGGTLLDYYHEHYASTTGEVISWVEVDDLSSTTDTTFLMYYGNSSATDQSNESGVWGALGEVAVYNFKDTLQDTGGDDVKDSTSNNQNASSSASVSVVSDNKINSGISRPSGDNPIYLSSNPFPDNNYFPATIVAWGARNSNTGDAYLVNIGDGSANQRITLTWQRVGAGANVVATVDAGASLRNAEAPGSYQTTGEDFDHGAAVFTNSTVQAYRNGVGSNVVINNISPRTATQMSIGNKYLNDSYPFRGKWDDIRIYDEALSSGDIKTIYHNTGSNETFLTYSGDKTDQSVGPATIELDNGSLITKNFGERTFYVNGSQQTSVATGTWQHIVMRTPFSLNATSTTIGAVSASSGNTYEGALDDVRFYEKKLSEKEVGRLYGLGNTTRINTTVSEGALERGLVGHWTFDGGAIDFANPAAEVRDVSGNDNTGDWENHASSTAIGTVGQALQFDGNDDKVVVQHNAILDLANFSISAWFKTSGGSEDILVITNKQNAFDDRNWWLAIDNGQGFAGGNGELALRTSSGGDIVSIEVDRDFRDGQWHHAVGVVNPAQNSASLWVDGQQEASQTGVGSPDTQQAPVIIGSGGDQRFFDGKIDDVRVYSRSLSKEEIQRLYDLGNTTRINTTQRTKDGGNQGGLEGHWTFDGPDMDLTNAAGEVRNTAGNGGTENWYNHATTTAIGQLGQALEFDGSDDYIGLGNSIISDGQKNVTFAGWARTDRRDAAQALLTHDHRYNNWHVKLYASNASGEAFFDVEDASDSCNISVKSEPITDTDWHHYAGVVEEGGSITLYIDGAVAAKTANSCTGDYNRSAFKQGSCIGAERQNGNAFGCNPVSGAGAHFDGAIDDVRYYNRALSQEEIQRLYEMGQ